MKFLTHHVVITDYGKLKCVMFRYPYEGALKSSQPNNKKMEFTISKLFLFFNIISL